MKKLIFVTLAAVAASWLVTESRRPGDLPPDRSNHSRVLVGWTHDDDLPAPPKPPKPPKPPRGFPGKKGDSSRSKVTTVAAAPMIPSHQPAPAWFPITEAEEAAKAQPDASGTRTIVGRVSASPDRANQDLRKAVEHAVGDWIAADVPTSWKVPANVLDRMAQEGYVQKVTRTLNVGDPEAKAADPEAKSSFDGLYTLYRAGQKLDFSDTRRSQIVRMYRQDVASWRMQRLGGGLVLALAGLAALSGYIKADEATKGYYTNRLRAVAAAGLGVAGVPTVAYRYFA